MPLVTAGNLSIFFAHVPKTGGSSIEDYLIRRFGPLSIREHSGKAEGTAQQTGQQTGQQARQRDLIQSASHLSAADLKNILPHNLNHSFAIVRSPLDRLISEYRFQANYSRTSKLSFSTWLRIMLKCAHLDPRIYENHIRPQSDLVPQGAEIFLFENGLDQIVPWLDQITGTTAPAIQMGHFLKRQQRPVAVSKQDIGLIREFYAADYTRFSCAEPRTDDHRHDAAALLRTALAAVLAPIIVFRQRRNWLR